MTEVNKKSNLRLITVEGWDGNGHMDVEISLADLLKQLEKQGVRLVEQPKCPDCVGTGNVPTYQGDEIKPCPRCGGSGYDRMVALGEVAEWLDDQCGSARMHAFLRRFGGGER